MTEEVKTCDCKEKCIEKLKEFAFIAGAVFVGATLAILLSANLLRPKCPCPGAMGPYPGIERQMPPAMMHHGQWGGGEFRGRHDASHKAVRQDKRHLQNDRRPNFEARGLNGAPGDFQGPKAGPKTLKEAPKAVK